MSFRLSVKSHPLWLTLFVSCNNYKLQSGIKKTNEDDNYLIFVLFITGVWGIWCKDGLNRREFCWFIYMVTMAESLRKVYNRIYCSDFFQLFLSYKKYLYPSSCFMWCLTSLCKNDFSIYDQSSILDQSSIPII